MDNIKAIKEAKNEAVAEMQKLNAKEDFSDADQKQWDKLKATVEAKNSALERAELLEKNEIDNAVRNKEDGEKQEIRNKFSFRNALRFAGGDTDFEGRDFYAEINEEGRKEATKVGGGDYANSALLIPSKILNTVSVGSEGEDLTFEEQGGFINKMKEKMVLTEMGAQFLENLNGDIRFPKETKEPTFKWASENGAITADDTEYGQVKLSPSRGAAAVDVSNQLLRQDSLGVESMLQSQMVEAARRGIESAAINGSSNGPSGILDVATEVADGAADFATIVALETAVASQNIEGNAYLAESNVRGALKQAVKDQGSGRFLWENDELNGYRAFHSNLVQEDSETAGDYPLIYGDFSQLVIGQFGPISILTNPYSKSLQGITQYSLGVYVGTAIKHSNAFSYANITV